MLFIKPDGSNALIEILITYDILKPPLRYYLNAKTKAHQRLAYNPNDDFLHSKVDYNYNKDVITSTPPWIKTITVSLEKKRKNFEGRDRCHISRV